MGLGWGVGFTSARGLLEVGRSTRRPLPQQKPRLLSLARKRRKTKVSRSNRHARAQLNTSCDATWMTTCSCQKLRMKKRVFVMKCWRGRDIRAKQDFKEGIGTLTERVEDVLRPSRSHNSPPSPGSESSRETWAPPVVSCLVANSPESERGNSRRGPFQRWWRWCWCWRCRFFSAVVVAVVQRQGRPFMRLHKSSQKPPSRPRLRRK